MCKQKSSDKAPQANSIAETREKTNFSGRILKWYYLLNCHVSFKKRKKPVSILFKKKKN